MFQIYLSDKRDLLVLAKGSSPMFLGAQGKWRKQKKVARVSQEISSTVLTQGYYMRKLSKTKPASYSENTNQRSAGISARAEAAGSRGADTKPNDQPFVLSRSSANSNP